MRPFLAAAALAALLATTHKSPMPPASHSSHTVASRLAEFGAAARARMAPGFAAAGVTYPPKRVVLAGFKSERRLEVWAGAKSGALRRVLVFPILAASGGPGPKLREGDLQVPEGLYKIESLNPNSRYHVALRVNYPNDFDRAMARKEGRDRPGSDIMIHGKDASIGCLAMGDRAAEELFTLAADAGLTQIRVVLSPVDFRTTELPSPTPPAPPWMTGVYQQVRAALAELR